MLSDPVGLALLAMANTVLLKYPRVRIDLLTPVNNGKQDDDEVRALYRSFVIFILQMDVLA